MPLTSSVELLDDRIVKAKVTIDRVGRVVLPKAFRDQMQLRAGDTLELESTREQVTLRPVQPKTALWKEHGVWVYHGELTDSSIVDLVDHSREQRLRELEGSM